MCEIDGWVLGGMPFGVLVHVLFWVMGTVRAHFCEIDSRVLGACSLGCWCRCCLALLVLLFEVPVTRGGHAVWQVLLCGVFGMLLEVLVTVTAHLCEIGRHEVWVC